MANPSLSEYPRSDTWTFRRFGNNRRTVHRSWRDLRLPPVKVMVVILSEISTRNLKKFLGREGDPRTRKVRKELNRSTCLRSIGRHRVKCGVDPDDKPKLSVTPAVSS